jgi:N-acetylmuramoyl-L-alanine amidase
VSPSAAAVAVLLGAAIGGSPARAAVVPHRLPAEVTVETPRGAARLAVRVDPLAGPVLPGEALVGALSGTIRFQEPWVEVTLARQSFRFLTGAPVYSFNDRLEPLAGWAYRTRDSLFLPLQFVTEILPQVLAERYAWDAIRARLLDTGPPMPATPPVPVRRVERLPNGLLPGHVVTVDAGHGGIDPGNPGLYFPRGIREKDVTLQVSLLLRDELRRRGIKVVMTRQADTLIGLLDRTSYCTAECDLFVSLHVDALDNRSRARFAAVRGFHTIIIGEENTEDADRIARMENEALRYESEASTVAGDDLGFILRNLQLNEYLRESARAAELVQQEMGRVHTGDNRGVKQSNQLAVLNTARRPAILVEMGYSTNQQDARLLTRRKSQQALATAMADAIVAYLLEYERKTGSPPASGDR